MYTYVFIWAVYVQWTRSTCAHCQSISRRWIYKTPTYNTFCSFLINETYFELRPTDQTHTKNQSQTKQNVLMERKRKTKTKR